MTDVALQRSGPRTVLAYRCSECSRCFVAVDLEPAPPMPCVCGASLEEVPLPSGIYELRDPLDTAATVGEQAATEPDGGYGASHGYAPAHSGPSGPGDAPADEPPTSS